MNRSLYWSLLAGFLVCGGGLNAELIAHYPLDETGEDVVGGYDGIETGDIEFEVDGANDATGTATRFFNGVIDVPFAEELNPEDFTITVWARSTGGAGHRAVITSRYDGIVFGGGNLDGYIIYANPSDQWQFWTGDGESAADIWDVLPATQVEFEEWQHLAITFDSETGEKNFYINGFLEATSIDQGYQPVSSEDRSLHIGGGGDLGDQFRWVGDLDDLGIWDEALTEDEILDVMENGISEFVPQCSVRRVLSTGNYAPGDTVAVTLVGNNLTGATTITDTFPQGWTVTNDGGGMVNGDTIAFTLDADGESSYELTVPNGFCQNVSFSGMYSGAGDCSGSVGGASRLACDPTAFACSVTREISPTRYVPGDVVTVSLSATNIAAATTITDTLPDGLQVATDGGGTVTDNTISFSLGADGVVSYEVLVPADASCDNLTFSGVYAGGANCDGEVSGAVDLKCGVTTLVAHWPLDESGEDVVGGFDGEERGDLQFEVPGVDDTTGDATSFFDGTIDVPFAADLNPESFTITVWARSTGGSGHRSVITSRYDGIVFGGDNLDGFIIYANPDDQWQFWTGDGERAVDGWDSLSGPQVVLDEWTHLAISFDSETGTKSFYVNGILEASSTDQGYQPVTNEERSLHIGAGGDLGDEFRWVGDIDDLGLWNGVLSEDTIVDIMENGIGSEQEESPIFRRGDVDSDGVVNITDAVANLSFQFSGGEEPGCMKAADVDGDGVINITDAVFELQYLFAGGGDPPAPFPDCGRESVASALSCDSSPCQ